MSPSSQTYHLWLSSPGVHNFHYIVVRPYSTFRRSCGRRFVQRHCKIPTSPIMVGLYGENCEIESSIIHEALALILPGFTFQVRSPPPIFGLEICYIPSFVFLSNRRPSSKQIHILAPQERHLTSINLASLPLLPLQDYSTPHRLATLKPVQR